MFAASGISIAKQGSDGQDTYFLAFCVHRRWYEFYDLQIAEGFEVDVLTGHLTRIQSQTPISLYGSKFSS